MASDRWLAQAVNLGWCMGDVFGNRPECCLVETEKLSLHNP